MNTIPILYTCPHCGTTPQIDAEWRHDPKCWKQTRSDEVVVKRSEQKIMYDMATPKQVVICPNCNEELTLQLTALVIVITK